MHSTRDFTENLRSVWAAVQPRSLWPSLKQTRWRCTTTSSCISATTLHFARSPPRHRCTTSLNCTPLQRSRSFQTNFLPASDLGLWKVSFDNNWSIVWRKCIWNMIVREAGEIGLCASTSWPSFSVRLSAYIGKPPDSIVSALHWLMQLKGNLKKSKDSILVQNK